MNEKYFNEIGIEDEFFDSLKYDYPGFENWFRRKYNQKAYVQYDNNGKICDCRAADCFSGSWNDCDIQQQTGKGTGADGSRACRRNAETGR